MLEGPVDPVRAAEVVDRRAARGEPGLERLAHSERERVALRPAERARRAQRMNPRAEEGLVGVDVPDAGDPPLVEQERLHRCAAPARERAQRGPVERGVQRLGPEPLGEEGA